jgi:hypothetical protein
VSNPLTDVGTAAGVQGVRRGESKSVEGVRGHSVHTINIRGSLSTLPAYLSLVNTSLMACLVMYFDKQMKGRDCRGTDWIGRVLRDGALPSLLKKEQRSCNGHGGRAASDKLFTGINDTGDH